MDDPTLALPEIRAAARWWADQLRTAAPPPPPAPAPPRVPAGQTGFLFDLEGPPPLARAKGKPAPPPEPEPAPVAAALADRFEEALVDAILAAYASPLVHWDPCNLMRSAVVREVSSVGKLPPKAVRAAAAAVHLDPRLLERLPPAVSMWVDPGCVRVSAGSARMQVIYGAAP